MTNLYEAGDINTVDGDEQADINSSDVNASDINASDDLGHDDEGNEPNEAFDGGTPLAVLSYLARSLSNEPDAVVIDSEERRGGLRLSLHVAPDDMGRVIGRRGRTAQAIRTLVNVAGAKDGVQASVDIVDD
ncbi:MAG: KH domain-containing protein [Acidimicrobiales bacterium]